MSNQKLSKETDAQPDGYTVLADAIFRPILFSTPMVQAILDGRKTQTRRGITQRNSDLGTASWEDLNFEKAYPDRFPGSKNQYLKVPHKTDDTTHRVHSKISVGEILWVRETFQPVAHPELKYRYKADHLNPKSVFWKPSIFMPKEACRIFLEVTNVRVERLQDISENDSRKEGIVMRISGVPPYDEFYQISKNPNLYSTAKLAFKSLWQSINGKESWGQNPWVWVYDFKRVEKPLGFC